ncbi:MAG: aminoglycoside phosphotransferase family protein [Chloroflexales bacterium]|nr:aminoglycoside phosphotransferase family protein [Chloroflexales bacterium]
MSTPLAALVEQLARQQPPYRSYGWSGWQIQPVPSGNNLLFRATGETQDVAVKFLIRDARQRAQREWAALSLIDRMNAPFGPRPLHYDHERLPHAAVVQTWLDGTALHATPTDDVAWLQIVQTYAAVHRLQLEDAARLGVALEPTGIVQTYAAVHRLQLEDAARLGVALEPTGSAQPVRQAGTALREFAQQIPPTRYDAALARLLQTIDELCLPPTHAAQRWVHGDPSIRNVVLTPQGAQLVDWEYSGLGDPAREIAMLMSHPFAIAAGEARWRWVAQHYAQLSAEADMPQRIAQQYSLSLAWWCVRLLVGRYVLLQRPTQRLVGAGAEAAISTEDNIARYFARAHAALNAFS